MNVTIEQLRGSVSAMQSRAASMEKQASILGLLGAGAVMHLAPNAVMKAIKSTRSGHNILTGGFSAGVDMGRQGLDLQHNLKNALQYGIGPESMTEIRLGQRLGGKLRGMDEEKQTRFLERLKGMAQNKVNQLPEATRSEAHKVPVVGTFLNYLEGNGNQKVKNLLMKATVPEGTKPSLLNRAGDVAALGGAAAIDSHLLLQPALSFGRKKIMESSLGQKIMRTGYEKGKSGAVLGKVKEMATDLFISPSVLDPYRIGRAAKTHLGEDMMPLADQAVHNGLATFKK